MIKKMKRGVLNIIFATSLSLYHNAFANEDKFSQLDKKISENFDKGNAEESIELPNAVPQTLTPPPLPEKQKIQEPSPADLGTKINKIAEEVDKEQQVITLQSKSEVKQPEPEKVEAKPVEPKEYLPKLDYSIIPSDIDSRAIYDFRDKVLPSNIQKRKYGPNNDHLPRVFYESEYTQYLFIAAARNDINAISALLERDADINAKDKKNGYTPLMYAVSHGKDSSYRYLILRGADLNLKANDGKTAMHIAAIKQDLAAIIELISNSALSYVKDEDNKSPIDYMPNLCNEFLIMVMKNDKNYNDGLAESIRLNAIVAAQFALKHGADVNYRNDKSKSPLLIAIENNKLEMANLLLTYGGKIENQEEVLHLATKGTNKEMLDLIQTAIVKQELAD
jgi:ankyrin repeat protein